MKFIKEGEKLVIRDLVEYTDCSFSDNEIIIATAVVNKEGYYVAMLCNNIPYSRSQLYVVSREIGKLNKGEYNDI